MRREPLVRIEGPAVALPVDDIDTDQIIPARFLKTTRREGLGAHLFADWRVEQGPGAAVVLDQPAARGARFLVAGQNFGCGSSREHAPWALVDFGFRAIVAASFADIFRQNALKNGLVPIVLPPRLHAAVLSSVTRQPGLTLAADLERPALAGPFGQVPFAIDTFARRCLIDGVDEIGYVLALEEAIAEYERGRGGRTVQWRT